VIDVTNQVAGSPIDHVGNFVSEYAHVVERLTMIDRNVIHYTATIDDPKVFTRPWTLAFGWRRNTEAAEMWEQSCWEGVQTALERTDDGRTVYPGAFAK
jgi:hypothetical protein